MNYIYNEGPCNYEKLVKDNKPRSGVTGDLLGDMIKVFAVELSAPLYTVFNNIVQSASWPQQWKTDYVTPIGKIPISESAGDLRPLSLTAFYSKVIEAFVFTWLL
jgi:hypothetical protein